MWFLGALIAMCAGGLIPLQTAANGNLKTQMNSPFLASFINCATGSSLLALVMLIRQESFLRSFDGFLSIPWYLYLSGPLGAVILVVAVILAPRLGMIGLSLSTMTGMLVSGLIFDHFAILNVPFKSFDLIRLLGLILMLLGVMIVLRFFSFLKNHAQGLSLFNVLFFLLGCFSGSLMTVQAILNAQMRLKLGSVFYCAFISMLTTALILIGVALLIRHSVKRFLKIKVQGRYWIFIGGVCGASYIIAMALLVPILGAATLMTLGIAGQLLSSLIIDHFGLLEQKLRKVGLAQILGLMLIIGAAVLMRL